ncbi:hypothetical protein SAMN05216409_11897 [Pseudomonas lutea]|uniref:Uncharacterized protein n=1 Tax=Pseudomonas lutea TaxID=243924 RepID=A0A9X8MH61_9PSED|nr:hypothetical protein SAMN05216409_11897 [Pseudomonas lutea]
MLMMRPIARRASSDIPNGSQKSRPFICGRVENIPACGIVTAAVKPALNQ